MDAKKKIYVTLVVFLIIGFILAMFATYPLFQEIKELSGELALAKKEQALFLKRKEDIEKMKAILKGHEEDFERMKELLVDFNNPLGFINFLEREAASANVGLKISSLDFAKEENPWPSFLFRIEAVGSFPNFLRFLERLESAPYLIQINNLDLRRVEKGGLVGGTWGEVKASFSIKVFTR